MFFRTQAFSIKVENETCVYQVTEALIQRVPS
jgi:hypothetical protein